MKHLLYPNPGKAKLWSKQVTVRVAKETVHCKLAVLPTVTDPPSNNTRAMLSVIAQLSNLQCRDLEEGRKLYKVSVSCEASAEKPLELPEAFLVEFLQKNGQLRYFQPLMSQKDLEECVQDLINVSFVVKLYMI